MFCLAIIAILVDEMCYLTVVFIFIFLKNDIKPSLMVQKCHTSRFSPSTLWVPGMECRPSGLGISILSYWTISLDSTAHIFDVCLYYWLVPVFYMYLAMYVCAWVHAWYSMHVGDKGILTGLCSLLLHNGSQKWKSSSQAWKKCLHHLPAPILFFVLPCF